MYILRFTQPNFPPVPLQVYSVYNFYKNYNAYTLIAQLNKYSEPSNSLPVLHIKDRNTAQLLTNPD